MYNNVGESKEMYGRVLLVWKVWHVVGQSREIQC